MMTQQRRIALALLALLASPVTSSAQDDAEERELRGRKSYENNCLMCHAAPLVEGQRLTPAQWKTELTKMIGWGAPVQKDEESALLDYLDRHFGADLPPVAPVRLTVTGGERLIARRADEANAPPGDTRRGAPLYAQHCASCHGPDGRGGEGGTNLVDRPTLDRPDLSRAVIREGRNRMPGFRAVLDRQGESDVLAWLRERAK
jgi:mono/diheme cytochrome c family protein